MKTIDPRAEGTGVSHYLDAAKCLLAAGKSGMALEALSVAREMDPSDVRIQTFLDNALLLAAHGAVDPGFPPPGDRERGGDAQDIRSRVRYLVDAADGFLARGLNESAFESLLCAYLLDPLAPEVMASEERILPILNIMRGGSTVLHQEIENGPGGSGELKVPKPAGENVPFRSSLRRWLHLQR
jgi:hypothetical protein